jgi:signal transduction histidine kinase/CheY-like chemotaxis protein
VLLAASAVLVGAQAPRTLTLDRAEFVPAADAATPPAAGAPWQAVPLPDTWRERMRPRPQAGWYRVAFDVAAPTGEIQALGFDRISWTSRIYLNGALLYEDGQAASRAHVSRTSSRLVTVPSALLRPGRNELLIGVHHGYWALAGLSPIEFGPLSALAPRFARERFWEKDLPQALNLVSMAMAGALLMIWLGRRTEVSVGCFGLLFLLGSFRNYSYFLERPFLPTALGDWLLYCGTAAIATLFGAFAISVAGGRHPRFGRALAGTALLLPLVGAGFILSRPDAMPSLRTVSSAWLLVLATYAYLLIVRSVRRRPDARAALVALGFGLVIFAAAHDYAYIHGWTKLDDLFWLPYAMPPVFVVFGLNLASRMLRALRDVEELTAGLEARVAQRTDELSRANAAKTRFLAAASHDLRQPLHAIGLLVGLVRERIRYPEVRLMVDKIQHSVDNMGMLLKGLLDISRLDAGAVRPTLQEVHVAELLASVREVEMPLARAKNIALRFAPCRAVVRTDRVLAESILRNLVANATRYTERGKVLVGARRRGATLTLQVHDTGIGIGAEHDQKIFEEFYQVGNAARDRTLGLGLGLSIVQRTAALLGHPLRFRSQPGRGSTFEFDLPLCTRLEPAPALLPGTPRHDVIDGNFVLIVEDNLAIRGAMEALFAVWGCHVASAASLASALAELENHLRQPDLLVCDYRLGEHENGVLAIQRLRATIGAEVPALLVTGDIAPRELLSIRDTDLPVLFKPVRPDELRAACARLLQGVVLAG